MSVSSEIAATPAAPAPQRSGSLPAGDRHVYGRSFWFAYISNTALMLAISLLYRYADFVVYLGGSEWTLGRIVGVGMIGSLVMRFFQGFGIDHFGPRRVWLWSMTGFVISLIAQVFITRADGPAIYLLRILYSTSVAGAFARRSPVCRVACRWPAWPKSSARSAPRASSPWRSARSWATICAAIPTSRAPTWT